MAENKKVKRRQGQHCKINEVKTEILMYILKANGAVSGSEIRGHLNKKFGIGNNKNIKDHLEKLRKDHCIEKFEHVGDDSRNEWDITKLENLKKIDEFFPKIQQNEYSKCLSLIPFEEIAKSLGCLNPEILSTDARTSRRFYDLCLKGDLDVAYSQTNVYFSLTEEGHEAEQYLNKSIAYFCEKYMEKDIVASEAEFKQYNFKKGSENLSWTWNDEKPELVMNKQLNDNISVLIFLQNILESSKSEMLEENSTVKKDISVEVQREIIETKFKALLENRSEELYDDIREIKTRQKINCISSYYLFFKSCVLQDFQNSVESSSEKYFLRHLEKYLAILSTIRKKDPACSDKEFGEFIKEQDSVYSSLCKSYFDQKDCSVVI